jgi:F-type H+-transporting ATPase subunit b
MRLVSLIALFSLVNATPAYAAEDAGGALMALRASLMFWTLLIFLILFFLLKRYAFGPITAAVEARERALEEAIAAAKRDREEAAKSMEEQKKAIQEARAEAQRLIAEGRSAGDKLKAEMLEQSRVQGQELLDRARRDIQAEKDRAVAELRKEAVDLAIAGAGKVIEKNLDDQSNRKLVEDFLSSIKPMEQKRR